MNADFVLIVLAVLGILVYSTAKSECRRTHPMRRRTDRGSIRGDI